MSARSKEFLGERATAIYRALLLESLIRKEQILEAEEQLRRLKENIDEMKALEGSAP